jgi:hypothetical protein
MKGRSIVGTISKGVNHNHSSPIQSHGRLGSVLLLVGEAAVFLRFAEKPQQQVSVIRMAPRTNIDIARHKGPRNFGQHHLCCVVDSFFHLSGFVDYFLQRSLCRWERGIGENEKELFPPTHETKSTIDYFD